MLRQDSRARAGTAAFRTNLLRHGARVIRHLPLDEQYRVTVDNAAFAAS